MRWGYKTIHFELRKDGLLGGGFLDETEMEEVLNSYGSSGWELVSILETRDGAIAVFKQPLGGGIAALEVGDDEYEEEKSPPVEMTAVSPASAAIEEREDVSPYDEEIYGYEDSVENEQMKEPAPYDEVGEDEEDDDDEPGVGSIRIE